MHPYLLLPAGWFLYPWFRSERQRIVAWGQGRTRLDAGSGRVF